MTFEDVMLLISDGLSVMDKPERKEIMEAFTRKAREIKENNPNAEEHLLLSSYRVIIVLILLVFTIIRICKWNTHPSLEDLLQTDHMYRSWPT